MISKTVGTYRWDDVTVSKVTCWKCNGKKKIFNDDMTCNIPCWACGSKGHTGEEFNTDHCTGACLECGISVRSNEHPPGWVSEIGTGQGHTLKRCKQIRVDKFKDWIDRNKEIV